MKLECSQMIFEKYPNIKFHENSPSGSRVLMRTDILADMTKLITTLRSFANAPKIVQVHVCFITCTHNRAPKI